MLTAALEHLVLILPQRSLFPPGFEFEAVFPFGQPQISRSFCLLHKDAKEIVSCTTNVFLDDNNNHHSIVVVRSPFALAYSTGQIPCRINHGSVKHKLQWDVSAERKFYFCSRHIW
jgi:hypothetical protein